MRPGERVNLREWPTIVKPFCKSKEQYQKLLEEHIEALSSLQQVPSASNCYALLLIDHRPRLYTLFVTKQFSRRGGPVGGGLLQDDRFWGPAGARLHRDFKNRSRLLNGGDALSRLAAGTP